MSQMLEAKIREKLMSNDNDETESVKSNNDETESTE
jgi:hypothetical protein